MCGRFTFIFYTEFFSRFALHARRAEIESRYNIAPTQEVLVIVDDGGRKVAMMRFGLIPSWSKEKKTRYSLINARAETVTKKSAFRRLLERHRCIIPTTGFYEWKKEGRRKVPYLVRLKDEKYFSLARLWDHWRSPSGEEIRSFAIVTTRANDTVSEFHDRMPVIPRKEEDEELWLSGKPLNGEDLARLFEPFPSSLMEAYRVSPAVNGVRNDDASLIELSGHFRRTPEESGIGLDAR